MRVSFSFKHWQFPFAFSINFFIETVIKSYFFTRIKSNLIFPILSSFSLLFSIIPENIYLHLNPDKKINQETRIGQFYYMRITDDTFESTDYKRKLAKQFLLISLLGLVTVFIHSTPIHFISLQAFGYITTPPLFCLIVTWVLHYLAFKQSLYSHHITALVIMILDTLIYYIYSFSTINTEITRLFGNWGLFVGLLAINIVSISLRESIEKYLMEILFVSSSIIIFFEGIISLMIYVAYFFIMQMMGCTANKGFFNELCYYSRWDFFKTDFALLFNFSSISTLYIWGLILFSFSANFSRILTNKKLSPTHRYIAEILLIVYWFIYNLIHDIIGHKVDVIKYIAIVVDSLVLIFACCLYNEFIIIYLWGLNANTHKEIEDRASAETTINISMGEKYITEEDNNADM